MKAIAKDNELTAADRAFNAINNRPKTCGVTMVPEHQQKEMLESLVKFYGCEDEVRPTRWKFGKLYRASHDATSNQAYNRQVIAKSAAEGVLKLAEEALEKA